MPTSMLTYRYRIKDATTGKHLARMSWAVHTVWNYCNEVSLKAFKRDRRFLSAFDLIKLCAGTSKLLGLHDDTIGEVCKEYVTRRKQFKKVRLSWRSRKRSLGWIPFKGRSVRHKLDHVTYKGKRLRFWKSRELGGKIKTGSFTQDARGRWYVNFQCEVAGPGTPLGHADIGIDLGLKNQAVCSDGMGYSRENLTRRHEPALATAQRARKKKRVTALHARIANTRTDWTHKTTTDLVRRARLLVVGNVSSTTLARTRLAKSVYDAGWGQFRTMLAYKAARLGVVYTDVNESGSTLTCSACLAKTSPSGLSQLGVRVWCCTSCGVVHDRDTNASQNILRLGRETLSGIPRL